MTVRASMRLWEPCRLTHHHVCCTTRLAPLSHHSMVCIRASWSKNNFDSIHARNDSNRFVLFYSPTHGRNPGDGMEGAAWLGAVYGGRAALQNMNDEWWRCIVIIIVLSAAVIRRSVLRQTDANNQYNRIGRSNFGGNRIDSNHESECCSLYVEYVHVELLSM